MTTSEERFEAFWNREDNINQPFPSIRNVVAFGWQEQDRYYEPRIKELDIELFKCAEAAGSAMARLILQHEAELAALKGKQEPVAEVCSWQGASSRKEIYALIDLKNVPDGTKLYFSPPNEKQIMDEAMRDVPTAVQLERMHDGTIRVFSSISASILGSGVLRELGQWFPSEQVCSARFELRRMAEELEK